ncbi:MAG: queuine tRNA-ribosyltransferase queuine tRNA-ribosyltransferase [Parcubacteria group bacterium]|nr:queuine tRNA-ribosyltransferase queuine tRNA-ribosyltransferase [Parcubacteria group bacterium]
MASLSFTIHARDQRSRARTGTITTLNGTIKTPAFSPVGTKAGVKGVTPDQLLALGAEVVLANTYHLYLQPGDQIVKDGGGLAEFMNWKKDGKRLPTITDSGGFQVFSLGSAFGRTLMKITKDEELSEAKPKESVAVFDQELATQHGQLAVIDDEGVTFTSHHDGSLHRFTPERSMEIQHNIGADIMFAFDECTSISEPYEYQQESMHRTHRWAARSIKAHKQNIDAAQKQALFGVIQGGRYTDLRTESAKEIASLGFDGFGIGGSFTKEDMPLILQASVDELPEDKPRHFLGIGEPGDILTGIAEGMDLFDCVAAARLGRHGTIYTKNGPIRITKEEYKSDFTPLAAFGLRKPESTLLPLDGFTVAYVSHLLRAGEFLGQTIASMHNLGFILDLMAGAREAIENGTFTEYRENFVREYYR